MMNPDPVSLARRAAWRAFHGTEGDSDDARLHAALGTFTEALHQAGLLILPDHQPTAEDVEDAARWLATASGHPRYTHPEGPGWQSLLGSETNVRHAFAAAQKTAGGDQDAVARLRAARDLLLRNTHPGTRR